MKHIFTFLSIVTSTFLFSQNWTTKELLDDFGDPTGKTITAFTTDANMKNSATTGANATVVIRHRSPKDFYVQIFEYGNNPANFMCDVIDVAIKTESGSVYSDRLVKTMSATVGVATATKIGAFEYGGDFFMIESVNPTKVKRLRKKGKIPLYNLISETNGVLKVAVSCGGAKYNFKIKGLSTPAE